MDSNDSVTKKRTYQNNTTFANNTVIFVTDKSLLKAIEKIQQQFHTTEELCTQWTMRIYQIPKNLFIFSCSFCLFFYLYLCVFSYRNLMFETRHMTLRYAQS